MVTASMRRAKLLELMGRLPENPAARGSVCCKTISVEDKGDYVLETLELNLNGQEMVPAYFTKPKTSSGKIPAVIFNHSHGGMYDVGKKELLTPAPYMAKPAYAVELAEMGYAALAIDHWNFGERHNRTESSAFKEMIWKGQVLWGMMVFDSIRALDYLTSRIDIDSNRIATLGMSMGSTMAWWLAALDERIKVCVDICCLTDFDALIEEKGLDGHGIYYYVPDLLTHFTATDINALIVPRPHLGLAGNLDSLTPVKGLDRIDADLKELYENAGVPDNWRLVREDVAHFETESMRLAIKHFLQKHL